MSQAEENGNENLPRDACVRVIGLVSAAQFNGKKGHIKSFLIEHGRYEVQLAKKKKTLAVKPTNLIVLCSKCEEKDAKTQEECPRCASAYCSKDCREVHWDTHKHNCVPSTMPAVPNIEEDGEAAERYLQLSADAHDDGRYLEEIRLLEAFSEKNPQQPGSIASLVILYKDIDQTKAFPYVEKLVAILCLAIDQEAHQFGSHGDREPDIDKTIFSLWRLAFDFMMDHRLKNLQNPLAVHPEIQTDAKVLEGLWKWAKSKGPEVVPRRMQSRLCLTLGDAYFVLEDPNKAIVALKMAHELVEDGEGNFDALSKVAYCILMKLKTEDDPEEIQQIYQDAVDQVREVKALMIAKSPSHPELYRIQTQIATILFDKYTVDDDVMFPDGKKQEIIDEIVDNASRAREVATVRGNVYCAHRVKQVFDGLQSKGWI